jgi:hypothetical protein
MKSGLVVRVTVDGKRKKPFPSASQSSRIEIAIGTGVLAARRPSTSEAPTNIPSNPRLLSSRCSSATDFRFLLAIYNVSMNLGLLVMNMRVTTPPAGPQAGS